ncbi:hypothetical protein WUBG_14882 [Wuchereria bancrofti]|nr:hypothetical protein WUBG_14882 [Wuchereria bancrofti]
MPPATVTPVCEDLYNECESAICTTLVASDICAKTCGFCGATPSTTVTPVCEDKYNKCKTNMNCTSALAKELCAKTCEFCDNDSILTPEGIK